jgi:CRISPR-associated endonuclease/helicase Cas3
VGNKRQGITDFYHDSLIAIETIKERSDHMHWSTFSEFFKVATGNLPFPYQQRFAEAPDLAGVLNVPTGAGKTAAMVLAWLWRRFFHPDGQVRITTPRRLVYCLPMRVLVEQTQNNVRNMLEKLAEHDPRMGKVDLVVFMGGETDTDWMLKPEQLKIIIGTQDMLLSAALNRGYAISRFRWPHAFGLLNNDCLWCFDEVQLMGSGLATSIQLDAFRKKLSCYGVTGSVWMSATLEPKWFVTPDFGGVDPDAILTLANADLQTSVLAKRMTAPKTVSQLPESLIDLKNKYPGEVAKQVKSRHIPGSLTLVILNQVERAQNVYRKLQQLVGKDVDLMLIHSRFRPADRAILNSKLLDTVGGKGRIVVSTQVVEAGVDISAATLFSELAPWPSLVQRFGRCNRYGELDQANIYWFDLDDKNALPYSPEELETAREVLAKLEGQTVSPNSLPKVDMPVGYIHIIRSRDIVELFDTSPDLSGNDVDVSRFIRDGEDMDVSFYWRDWQDDKPYAGMAAPRREELCSVQVWIAKKFIENGVAWRWDHLGDGWTRLQVQGLRPGMIIMLNAGQGGYSADLGWTGVPEDVPAVLSSGSQVHDDTAADHMTFLGRWLTLAQHSDDVVSEMSTMLAGLDISEVDAETLRLAARWHDAGKAHEVFQQTMRSCGAEPPTDEIWAKSPAQHCRHKQPHFRHELASTLSYLVNRGESDLIAYLVAAHHGKVRLSIRSLPGEKLPRELAPDTRIARGIWDGSVIYATNLGGGVSFPETRADLSLVEMGEGSWLERTLKLRDEFGPFKLAFMEALVRIADIRASIWEGKEV